MTVNQAKQLKQGQLVYAYMPDKRRKGWNPSGMRWIKARVTSVKTWKTRPDKVIVGLKYGMYDYFRVSENDLSFWKLEPTHHKGDAA